MISFKTKFLYCVLFLGTVSLNYASTQVDPGDPLYLTPIIKSGNFSAAQEASRTNFSSLSSYSGLITVNDEYNSNLFFWYFPSETAKENDTTPVILWSDGGPGVSCMVTVFGRSGPFLPKGEMDFELNPISWHKKYHMIYLDNPVGVGFSHTRNESGNVDSAERASLDIYEFLQQFFMMFPNLKSNPFYNAGGSFGGKYASEVAELIHRRNQEDQYVYINLTGVILDSPWLDPISQVDFANALFGAGVINKAKRDEIKESEDTLKSLVQEGRYAEATQLTGQIIFNIAITTGYNSLMDLIDDGNRGMISNMTALVTQNETRKALHVGNLEFIGSSNDVIGRMEQDRMHSSAEKLDILLKSNLRMLLLVGNADVLTGHYGIRNLFERKLTWEGGNELVNGNRSVYLVGTDVAGYISNSGGARLLLVRNAGHGTYLTQDKWVWEALKEFLG